MAQFLPVTVWEEKSKSYRDWVDTLDEPKLILEFTRVMRHSSGKLLTLDQAKNLEYLLQKLQAANLSQLFKDCLEQSLQILRAEIQRLRN